ncbi:MAG TPA: hypothetical protein VJU14_03380 [Solirubrobacterales bacterium]|nr:hypothetical protein [Solirubrobacterales bacterium]
MSYLDELIAAYRKYVALPWADSLAPAQRVWMAVYPPDQERRLRLHLQAFQEVTVEHRHQWAQVDITKSFEAWAAAHPYGAAYFESPELFASALPGFFDHLVEELRRELRESSSPEGVVALVGAGSLFGLGEAVKVSALLNAVSDSIPGRLLVFFPGDVESNNFRLLDGRDGWNYMAIVIKPEGSRH